MQEGDSVISIAAHQNAVRWPKNTQHISEKNAMEMAFADCRRPDFWRTYTNRPYPQFRSDFLRLWFAANTSHMLYADTDCELLTVPNFAQGKPFLAQAGHGVEFFLFYTNDRPDWFRTLMSRIEQTNPRTLFIPFLLNQIQKAEAEAGVISGGFFRHMRLGEYK